MLRSGVGDMIKNQGAMGEIEMEELKGKTLFKSLELECNEKRYSQATVVRIGDQNGGKDLEQRDAASMFTGSYLGNLLHHISLAFVMQYVIIMSQML